MGDHDFFTKDEVLELLKRAASTTVDPIKQERKHISRKAEEGCYEVIIRYDLSDDKIQILRDLGFTVLHGYRECCDCIYNIAWVMPTNPKDTIPGMDKEDIEDFNAIKMHARTKEVNAATLREVKKIITPIIEKDNAPSNTVVLDKELSNRISISSEAHKTIMNAGFDLSTNRHGRIAIHWSRLKYEARKQRKDEDNNDYLKEVLAKVRNSASNGYFNVDLPLCPDYDLYEKTEEQLTSLGYIVHNTAFYVRISWYEYHQSAPKLLDACQAHNMAIDFNKRFVKWTANAIKDLQDEKCHKDNIRIRKDPPTLAKKVLDKHGISIVKEQFAENDETYIITWRDMLKNALDDMVTDELLM